MSSNTQGYEAMVIDQESRIIQIEHNPVAETYTIRLPNEPRTILTLSAREWDALVSQAIILRIYESQNAERQYQNGNKE